MIHVTDKPWSGKINSQRRTLKCRQLRTIHNKEHSRQPFKEWARQNFDQLKAMYPGRNPTPMLCSKALITYCRF